MGVVQCLFQSFVRWLEAGWSNSSFSLLAPGMFSGARSTWSSAMLVILYLPRGVLSLTSKQLPVIFWNRSIWHLHMYLHHRKFFFWEVSPRRDLSHLFILLPAKSTFLGTVLLFLGNLNIHPLFHSIGFEKQAFYTWKNNHVMYPSIPAELSPAQPPTPPGLMRDICLLCQSQGWGICKFCAARGPGICKPRGQPRAFDTHAVSYQNITTQRILLEKQADWLISRMGKNWRGL